MLGMLENWKLSWTLPISSIVCALQKISPVNSSHKHAETSSQPSF